MVGRTDHERLYVYPIGPYASRKSSAFVMTPVFGLRDLVGNDLFQHDQIAGPGNLTIGFGRDEQRQSLQNGLCLER